MNGYNDKGEKHGYWELYYIEGNIWRKGNYVNNLRDGYWESYWSNGSLRTKEFYL